MMTRHWRRAGKNTDGRPGLAWDVTLYVPLVVLMLVKHLNARDMESYLAENVVARVFIGRQDDPRPQIRDHSNVARAYTARGKDGVEEINALILRVAQAFGFADARILSSDPRPGVAHRLSQRTGHFAGCGAALWPRLGEAQKAWGIGGRQSAGTGADDPQIGQRTPSFCQGQGRKASGVDTPSDGGGSVDRQTRPMVARLAQSRDRVPQSATATLGAMHEVAKRLIPQIVQWITTEVVAKGKIVHAGLTQARAMVRNKAGKKVEFGVSYLLSRLGGGYVFGTLIRGVVDESKMPMQALAGYRAIFGPQATPTLVVYDRGGYATATLRALANAGVNEIGIQPKGKGAWRVAEAVRETVRSERGKTDGIIGTLKTDKYGFNKPKERLWQTLEMAGPRSILSFNLNKLMRDLVRADQ